MICITPKTVNERTRWAINYIIKKERLSNVKLAERLEIATGTVNSYRTMTTPPNVEFLSKFCELFNFEILWFVNGQGEPFQGAYQDYPEVCDPVGFKFIKNEANSEEKQNIKTAPQQQSAATANGYNYTIPETTFSYDQKINIDEAIGKTIRVLSAGTALSVALYMNIQQFAAALDTGQELKECKELIKGMQEQIDALTAKVDRLTAPSTAERQGDGSGKEAM